MPRRPQSAAEYVEMHAIEVSIILAELAESAGAAGRAWALAVSHIRDSPDAAMDRLARASIEVGAIARYQVADSLRVIRRAMDILDLELPDESDTDPAERSSG